MKLSVLVTCPPMLGMKDQFLPLLEEKGIKVSCPDVVQTLSEKQLINLLPDFDGWILGDDPASRSVLEAGKNGRLKAVVKWGIGVDNVDFEACADFRIAIENTPGMFGAEVADVALGYLIGLARQTYYIDRQVRSGQWTKVSGSSLAGKTVGLVGHGDIGSNFAKRAMACGLMINAYDPLFSESDNYQDVEFYTWPERLNHCDFLVITCALTDSNHHMLDEEQLDACKLGVHVINVARGPLINETALVRALKLGKVSSVALDVFETEPLPLDSPLRQFDQCILGSHNSSNTTEAVAKTNLVTVRKMLEMLNVG